MKRHVNPTRIPIECKESIRWTENAKVSSSLLRRPAQCLHIGDRESDIYALFYAAQEEGARFLVRSGVDRRSGSSRVCNSEQMAAILPQGQHRVLGPSQNGSSSEAVLEIKLQRLLLYPPEGKQKRYPALTVSAIHAYEVQTAENRERIDWTSLTDVPIDHLKTAVCQLERYGMRWKIRGTEVSWLTMNQREEKEASPTLVFTGTEQKVLDHLVRDSPSESRSLRLRYSPRKVARLGGHLARKSDPPPGNIVIWLGFRKLKDLHASPLATCIARSPTGPA